MFGFLFFYFLNVVSLVSPEVLNQILFSQLKFINAVEPLGNFSIFVDI